MRLFLFPWPAVVPLAGFPFLFNAGRSSASGVASSSRLPRNTSSSLSRINFCRNMTSSFSLLDRLTSIWSIKADASNAHKPTCGGHAVMFNDEGPSSVVQAMPQNTFTHLLAPDKRGRNGEMSYCGKMAPTSHYLNVMQSL